MCISGLFSVGLTLGVGFGGVEFLGPGLGTLFGRLGMVLVGTLFKIERLELMYSAVSVSLLGSENFGFWLCSIYSLGN